MLTFLLVVIYLSFISLGLPDSLLGSAWPVLHEALHVSVSYAGVISMIVAGGTIVSSFFSEKVIRRFGTGKVTTVSVLMTAAALLGNSMAPGFLWFCLFAVPLGLGAGAVDAALNNFVVLHYSAKQMNWLHCFWGIGATVGPVIMSYFLMQKNGWRLGYLTISAIQLALVALLFLSLPKWGKFESRPEEAKKTGKSAGLSTLLKISGAKPALLSFFCYCALELTCGLWGSTYLVGTKGIRADVAAKWIALFYLGITAGRFLSGFAAVKVSNKAMIRFGEGVCLSGIALLLLPLPAGFQLPGFILIGLGCAPVYPCMLHETPNRFGKDLSQAVMGIQMACAYVGSTFMPPLFGLIAEKTSVSLFPFFLLLLAALMIATSERINRVLCKRDAVNQ